ncbi:MAG: glycosyltransferase [Nitrospirae bacterium]|nr:glycosyltransferase [Nitrospirota bacterium]
MSIKGLRRRIRLGWEDASYRRRARRRGLMYDPARIASRVRHPEAAERLARAMADGTLRTFAAVRHHNWEGYNLIPALAELGEVIHFDWGAEGFPPDRSWAPQHKRAMNRLLLERFQQARAAGPVHLCFMYVTGRQVFPETVRAIGEAGTVTVNISLDDRAKFRGRWKGGTWLGVAPIAPAFDLCWTSTRDACEKYLVEGANPIFLPEGANPHVYRPVDVPFEYDVSFVGQCYGIRPELVDALAARGIRVACFGKGWPNGPLPIDEMVATYSKSRINLGFGGVGDGDDLLCLKGRDFEVPMAGGLYLTRYNPELAEVYAIGREIVCYRDLDELAERIGHLLDHPDQASVIRNAGYRRARADHAWSGRMGTMLRSLAGP